MMIMSNLQTSYTKNKYNINFIIYLIVTNFGVYFIFNISLFIIICKLYSNLYLKQIRFDMN